MQKRKTEAQQCSYNGKRIASDSKWYKKYKEVCQLYDYLIEAGQLLKRFQWGPYAEYAANKLAAYKSRTGYDSPMNKFTTNYLEVGSELMSDEESVVELYDESTQLRQQNRTTLLCA